MRFEDSRFRAQGPGFRVQGREYRVTGVGSRVSGLGCRVDLGRRLEGRVHGALRLGEVPDHDHLQIRV